MRILFLCSSNIFRSQMAEAFFNNLSKKDFAESAALVKEQYKMHILVVKAMKEEGIDISNQKSKKLTEDMLKRADFIIFMNKNLKSHLNSIKANIKENCKIEFWNIPDIVAREEDIHLYSDFLKARKIIKKRVINFINQLKNNHFPN